MALDGVLNWKKCKKCGEIFDIFTSSKYCPLCRKKRLQKLADNTREWWL